MSQANRKRTMKRFLPYIVIAVLMVLLLLTTLILHLVQVRPLEPFMNFDRVFIMDSFDSATATFIENQADILEDSLESTGHSALRGMFGGGTGRHARPHTVVRGGEEVRVSFDVSGLRSIRPASNEFMFMLEWDEVQRDFNRFYYYSDNNLEQQEKRYTIPFDRMIIITPSPAPELQRVRIIPFLFENVRNGRGYAFGDYFGPGFNMRDENGLMNTHYYRVYEFSVVTYVGHLHRLLYDNNLTPGGGIGLG